MNSQSNLTVDKLTDRLTDKTTVPLQREHTINYEDILKSHGIIYKTSGYYLQAGEISQIQGWLLHLSIITIQLNALLETIIPELTLEKVPFKIPLNKTTTDRLLDGMYGYTNVGKIVCIYPETEQQALRLAQKLILLTKDFKGPEAPSCRHLGGVVYTRYGAFNGQHGYDSNGVPAEFIYNLNGELIQDINTIPFVLPDNINWPFTSVTNPTVPARKKLLNDKIKPVELIKANVKGRVMKGLYMKNWLNAKYCLVKEGKENMFSDDFGRDIQDRLEWQLQLHKDLSTESYIPKIIDFFYEEGDAYLAMEFINGVSLDDKILSIYSCNRWSELVTENQLLVIDYLLQIIDMVQTFHKKGYVHRDISCVNFIVDKRNRLFMIDLELVYSQKLKQPTPAFTLGTIGFMSPEQQACEIPTVKEDIYGLGALMIVFFTSQLPIKFDTTSAEELQKNLSYFITQMEVVKCIARCLESDPDSRPELSEITAVIQGYRKQLLESKAEIKHQIEANITDEEIAITLNKSLNALTSEKMMNDAGLWISLTSQTNQVIENLQGSYSNYVGLFEGISGVFYTLFTLKESGFSIDSILHNSYKANLEFLQQNCFTNLQTLPSGFFAGTAGVALMLASGVKCGFMEDGADVRSIIRACTERDPRGIDLASGAAGQGISILQCMPYLPADFVSSKLNQLVAQIVQKQLKDGSWEMPSDSKPGKGIKITGLANGVSGIIYFLLSHSMKYNDSNSRSAAIRALTWLQKQAHKKGNNYIWYTNSLNKQIDAWLMNGVTGIALTFIKAYETLRDPIYKQLAEAALNNHTPHVIYRNLSHAWGVTGLGEVYLEAAHVFKDEKWQTKADWIAGSLLQLRKQLNTDSYYWTIDSSHTMPDLMTGISGIIHFLARHHLPDQIGYPLLSIA